MGIPTTVVVGKTNSKQTHKPSTWRKAVTWFLSFWQELYYKKCKNYIDFDVRSDR